MKKTKITNINRFVSFIIILVLIMVAIIIGVLASNARKITDSTNISKLNSSKFSEKILEEYEKEGKKEQFVSDYNKVQDAIGMYILNNSITDGNNFESIINDVNKKLSKDEWQDFDITSPSSWNGDWSVDSDGIVKFRFDRKSIEPSWAYDEQINSKVILN